MEEQEVGEELTPINLIEYDSAEEGVIMNRWSNTRIFMFGSTGWSLLRHDLETQYFEGGLAILNQLGYTFGQNLGHLGLQRGMTVQTLLATLATLASGGGWGKITLSGGDPATGSWRLRQENCVFCSTLQGEEKPSCEFLAGVLKGLTEVVVGKEQIVEEVECAAMGDRACEFSIRKKKLFAERVPES